MANIQEIRQQFPEYQDLSDQQLADGLYKKYYSDMPKEQFDQKMDSSNAPNNPGLMDKLKYSTGLGRDPLDQLRDLAAGAVGGVVHGGELLGKGLMQIPGLKTAARYYHNKLIPDSMTVSDQDTNDFVNKLASPNKSIGGNLLQGLGSYLPYGIAGGPSILGQIGAGAASGAALADPEQQNLFGFLPKGSMGGAMEGALLNALIPGAVGVVNKLRPTNLLRGTLSPEELKGNIEASAGTPTGLGDVIGSPFLKRQYENVFSKFPLSGATNKLQQSGQAVENKGKELLQNILGDKNPENVSDQLNASLTSQFEKHKNLKNSLYDKFNEESEKQFLNLPLNNLASKAKEYRDAIENSNVLKFEPDMKRIFSKLAPYENPVVKIPGSAEKDASLLGENLTTHILPTAKEANLLKGKLNHYAQMYGVSPDPEKRMYAKVFGDLSSALKKDINTAVDESGNENLKNTYKEAEQNYAKNFSPFLDKEIYKFIGGKKDPDTLVQSFLQTSRVADKGRKLQKISDRLPDQDRNLLAYAYFSRSLDNEGNFHPNKLSTLIKNLGKNQLNALVPDQTMRNQLKNYNKLYSMNTKGVNIMQNQATGQQNLDILPSILAHTGATLSGGMLGGLPGALAGLIGPGLAAKPIVHWLTNPLSREAFVKKMLENRQWNDPKLVNALQAGAQGALNQK